MSFFSELKRRNVYRAGAAYIVSAWLIVQVVETTFPVFGIPDDYIRIIISLLGIGFLPAVVLAWAFELTPWGLIRDSEVDRAAARFSRLDRNLDRLIIFLLVVAIGYFLIDKFIFAPHRETEIAEVARKSGVQEGMAKAEAVRRSGSIVVLPFSDMSPQQDHGFLADGLAEELMAQLARFDDLRVISRTSSFAFKGKEIGIPEIAERLDVGYILEGSVRTDGDRLRITTQLIDSHGDNHLWAANYERPFAGIFDIQDEIVALIVRDLGVNVGDELPQFRRTVPAAYALYLQSKVSTASEDAIEESIDKLKQAVEIDPSFATGWAMLGHKYFFLATNFESHGEESLEIARRAADRALRLDPYCTAAHALLGKFETRNNNLQKAAGHFERALELEPSNLAVRGSAAMLLQSLGRFDEALQVIEFALDRDPLSGVVHSDYALTALMDRQMAKAEEHWERAVELNSEGPYWRPLFIGLTLGFGGDNVGALEVLESIDSWIRPVGLAWIYQRLGRVEDYERELAEISELEGQQPLESFARVYALLGNADAAFQRLDLADNYVHWNRERYFPFYWPIEEDPRWEEFLRKAGVSDSQLSRIEFDFNLTTVQ